MSQNGNSIELMAHVGGHKVLVIKPAADLSPEQIADLLNKGLARVDGQEIVGVASPELPGRAVLATVVGSEDTTRQDEWFVYSPDIVFG